MRIARAARAVLHLVATRRELAARYASATLAPLSIQLIFDAGYTPRTAGGAARLPVAEHTAVTAMFARHPGGAAAVLGDAPPCASVFVACDIVDGQLRVVGLRVVAVLFLLTLIFRARRGQPLHVTSLVLVLAGALGNLYDNLFLPAEGGHPYGKVRDFIDVYFAAWDLHFPTFNVADACISVGAVLLLATSLFGREEAAR